MVKSAAIFALLYQNGQVSSNITATKMVKSAAMLPYQNDQVSSNITATKMVKSAAILPFLYQNGQVSSNITATKMVKSAAMLPYQNDYVSSNIIVSKWSSYQQYYCSTPANLTELCADAVAELRVLYSHIT